MTSADIAPPEDSGNEVLAKAFVYVISAGNDAVKIGVARKTERRIKGLQTGHYQRLRIAHQFAFANEEGAYAVEHHAHELLAERRLEGEWFAVTAEEAKTAVEQAIYEQNRTCAIVVKGGNGPAQAPMEVSNPTYLGPETIPAPSWMREPEDVIDFVLAEEGEAERSYLFEFEHSVVFVGYRRDSDTSTHVLFMNDVSRWHLQKECGVQKVLRIVAVY